MLHLRKDTPSYLKMVVLAPLSPNVATKWVVFWKVGGKSSPNLWDLREMASSDVISMIYWLLDMETPGVHDGNFAMELDFWNCLDACIEMEIGITKYGGTNIKISINNQTCVYEVGNNKCNYGSSIHAASKLTT